MDVKRAFHKWCEGREGKLQDLIWDEIRFEVVYLWKMFFFRNFAWNWEIIIFFFWRWIEQSFLYFYLLTRNYSTLSRNSYISLRKVTMFLSIFFWWKIKGFIGIFFKRNFYPSLKKITILLLPFWWKIKEFLPSLNEIQYESSTFFQFRVKLKDYYYFWVNIKKFPCI